MLAVLVDECIVELWLGNERLKRLKKKKKM